jgi:hypothetical protein
MAKGGSSARRLGILADGSASDSPLLIEGDMTAWVGTLWELIFADDPVEIAQLEAEAGMSQSDAVDTFIEHSIWDRDLPDFVGRKGTATQRREALRAAYRAEFPDRRT